MEYQRIAAAGFFFLSSTDPLLRGFWNGAGVGSGGLVFGTLLGPEATGPWFMTGVPFLAGSLVVGCGTCLFLVSWLHRSHGWLPLVGVVCGVCGLGLLFENYIVDASILKIIKCNFR